MVDTAYCPWDESPHRAWLSSALAHGESETVGVATHGEPQIVNGDSKAVDREPQAECECVQCEEIRSLRKFIAYINLGGDEVTLMEEQYALCSPWVCGYVLSARKWGTVTCTRHVSK